jgi:hypothetical protein
LAACIFTLFAGVRGSSTAAGGGDDNFQLDVNKCALVLAMLRARDVLAYGAISLLATSCYALRIGVTGAHGYLGNEVVWQAVSQGHKVSNVLAAYGLMQCC